MRYGTVNISTKSAKALGSLSLNALVQQQRNENKVEAASGSERPIGLFKDGRNAHERLKRESAISNRTTAQSW